jgi:hypothetical protein
MSERHPMKDLEQAYIETNRALPACPTAREIRLLREGALPEERAFVVEFHLSDCPECIELLERLETPEGQFEMEAAEIDRLEGDIARKLGLREGPAKNSFRDAFSWLWTVRTPIFVPAAAAAILLVMLILPGGPGSGEAADSTAGVLPLSSILIDQAVQRGGGQGSEHHAVPAGQAVLVEVFLESLELGPNDPVHYRVLDGAGVVLLDGKTAVLEDYNVRVALRLNRPGTHTLELTAGENDTILETIDIDVLP